VEERAIRGRTMGGSVSRNGRLPTANADWRGVGRKGRGRHRLLSLLVFAHRAAGPWDHLLRPRGAEDVRRVRRGRPEGHPRIFPAIPPGPAGAHRAGGPHRMLRRTGLAPVVGLLARPAALGLCVVSIVAMAKVHLPQGLFINWSLQAGKGHGYEMNLAFSPWRWRSWWAGPGPSLSTASSGLGSRQAPIGAQAKIPSTRGGNSTERPGGTRNPSFLGGPAAGPRVALRAADPRASSVPRRTGPADLRISNLE
jgi:hypothetical protein